MRSGIYVIENKVNQRLYVGSSKDLDRRRRQHWQALASRTHWNSHLQRAWDKYGSDAFTFVILERVPEAGLLAREQIYINLAWNMSPMPYNQSPTAGSCLGAKLNSETRKNMSRAGKARWANQDYVQCGPLCTWLRTLSLDKRVRLHRIPLVSKFYRDVEREVWEDEEDPEL